MIRATYRPHNFYCLHIDGKKDSDETFALVKKFAGCFDNIFVVENRTQVKYAGYSRLEGDIKCMDELLRRDKKWRYLINLCGADFPLKTNYQMVNYLRGLYPHQSAESFNLPRGSGKSLRFEKSWWPKTDNNPPPKPYHYVEEVMPGCL